jgi:predicted TIM-barrel fold metal-dependent hydrolase
MNEDDIRRRTFLKRAGLAAMAASGLRSMQSHAQEVLYSSGSEPPKLKVPENSCDCHMHFYDGRFPPSPSASLRPPDARVDYYRALQKRLGTTRNVIVQPSTYGTDNRCTLAALREIGGTARAVAVVDTSVTDQELKRLDNLGVRGIRFNLVQAGATTPAMVIPLSQQIASLGWHIQIHALGNQIADMDSMLMQVQTPMVFDHMGRIPLSEGVNHPGFKTIRKLIDKGNTWVKLSGAYMAAKPPYAEVKELAQAYVKAAPERMVWATDWPHPTEPKDKPDDAVMLDLLADWAPDERVRNRILVTNPEVLYGFPAGA